MNTTYVTIYVFRCYVVVHKIRKGIYVDSGVRHLAMTLENVAAPSHGTRKKYWAATNDCYIDLFS